MSMTEPHLKHKKAKLTELKDKLLTREIKHAAYEKEARPLVKEIQELEATLELEKKAGGEAKPG